MKRNNLLFLSTILVFVSALYAFNVQANSLIKNESVNNEARYKESRILEGKTIVIDAGHGGKDVGATGQTGILEKDMTLQTVLRIKRELIERTGANVILTREKDEFLALPERVEVAANHAADLFISIHFDAYTSHDVAGITTYYNKSVDKQAAKMIHEQLFKQKMDTKNRGLAQGDYHVLRENKSPSILLELGYLSNLEDEQRIQTQAFQDKAATAVTEGIMAFFQ
ncbi:N-acetylmuramoyl-L-alanine amidase LytC precursor [compost metagenome]